MLRLDVFTPTETADFWRKKLGAGDNKARAQLAAELGYLPLALEQAAAYMAENELQAAGYLALYQARRQELWQDTEPPEDYHATITTTWNISFAQARQTPGAADLLSLCSFLAPDHIPLALLRDYVDALPVELATVLDDELAGNKAIRALERYSLLTRTDGLLSVHRLVQTVVRDQMGAERIQKWAAAAIKLTTAMWPFKQYEVDTWVTCDSLLPHLQTVSNLAHQYQIITKEAALLNNDVDFYLGYFGDLKRAKPYCERALAIHEQALDSDPLDIASNLNNLGSLLQAMGQLAEARPFYQRALTIYEQTLGDDHPHTAISLNNLASLLKDMGQWADALPFSHPSS